MYVCEKTNMFQNNQLKKYEYVFIYLFTKIKLHKLAVVFTFNVA